MDRRSPDRHPRTLPGTAGQTFSIARRSMIPFRAALALEAIWQRSLFLAKAGPSQAMEAGKAEENLEIESWLGG